MRETDRDWSGRAHYHLRFTMNGRQQTFAWAKLADQTVGPGVRVVLVPSDIPVGEGSERLEPTIVPWPMQDFDVSRNGPRKARRSRATG
jgi:hypothetical protein